MMTDARKKNVTPPGISPEQKPEEPPKKVRKKTAQKSLPLPRCSAFSSVS